MEQPDWYRAWRHEAFHLLQDKNARLNEEFRIGSWPRFDFDLGRRSLVFSEDGVPKVIAEIQIAGTTSRAAGNWLWAWANQHWPREAIEDADRTRAFGEARGIIELTSDYVRDEENDLNALGWELTAAAARVTDAVGAYRPPRDEGGGLFLLYRTMCWA